MININTAELFETICAAADENGYLAGMGDYEKYADEDNCLEIEHHMHVDVHVTFVHDYESIYLSVEARCGEEVTNLGTITCDYNGMPSCAYAGSAAAYVAWIGTELLLRSMWSDVEQTQRPRAISSPNAIIDKHISKLIR